jgi:hypothetical protein
VCSYAYWEEASAVGLGIVNEAWDRAVGGNGMRGLPAKQRKILKRSFRYMWRNKGAFMLAVIALCESLPVLTWFLLEQKMYGSPLKEIITSQ